VNFVSGLGDKGVTRFIGSEGALEMLDNGFSLTHSIMSKAPGIGGWDAIYSYPQAMQDELMKQYDLKYTPKTGIRPEVPVLLTWRRKNMTSIVEHFRNFFDGVRNNLPLVEGPEFAFRAAAPTLACNDSYFQKKIINWDPVSMKVV